MHAARSQTVIVVVLLAMDFWNCRVRLLSVKRVPSVLIRRPIQNVAGRTLVGLRFWNQVCTLRVHTFRSE
jgi:hypothetical protein